MLFLAQHISTLAFTPLWAQKSHLSSKPIFLRNIAYYLASQCTFAMTICLWKYNFCGKPGLQGNMLESMISVLCFLEGKLLLSLQSSIPSLHRNGFHPSSSEKQRGCRPVTPCNSCASSCKQQACWASIPRLSHLVTDNWRQVLIAYICLSER